MLDLHQLCLLTQRPITSEYSQKLRSLLESGIPATYTLEQAAAYNAEEQGLEAPETSGDTTPLHILCSAYPEDATADETTVVLELMDILMEYGAGWNHTDGDNRTPGCVLVHRKLTDTPLYKRMVSAGVQAELLLRKVSEYDMEVLSDDEVAQLELQQAQEAEQPEPETKEEIEVKQLETKVEPEIDDGQDAPDAPSLNQTSYLNTKLEYTDDALVTAERKDGVMMAWETQLMELGAKLLFAQAEPDNAVVLNIGFGMGIIDTFIQQKNPKKHYICEAHPDVLAKMKQDGWYAKPNVVVLEGRWQDNLDALLLEGVFFDGIYYDTFSEHYADMLELYDYVVGLLKPQGVFLFFNGLGADRQVVYDVYKELVDLDLSNYGLTCKFEPVAVPAENMANVWDDVKRLYWACPTYYHPQALFAAFEDDTI